MGAAVHRWLERERPIVVRITCNTPAGENRGVLSFAFLTTYPVDDAIERPISATFEAFFSQRQQILALGQAVPLQRGTASGYLGPLGLPPHGKSARGFVNFGNFVVRADLKNATALRPFRLIFRGSAFTWTHTSALPNCRHPIAAISAPVVQAATG